MLTISREERRRRGVEKGGVAGWKGGLKQVEKEGRKVRQVRLSRLG